MLEHVGGDDGVEVAPAGVGLGGADVGRTGCLPSVALTSAPAMTPAALTLRGNHPNPFNPRIEIGLSIDRPGRVTVTVFDLRGRRVRTLVDESRPAGASSILWDGTDSAGNEVASGVYAVQFVSDGRADYRKVTLVR